MHVWSNGGRVEEILAIGLCRDVRVDDKIEPIADEEVLYRRVPVSTGWYDSESGSLKPQAFEPHKRNDITGLSISRKKYKSIEEAARGRPGKSYYVAVLRAADLRKNEITIVPRPDVPGGYDPGHAEIPNLNAGNRKEARTIELQRILVELCLQVEGPFPVAAANTGKK